MFNDSSSLFLFQGYDISFLITNYHCEEMQKHKLIDFIVQFMEVRFQGSIAISFLHVQLMEISFLMTFSMLITSSEIFILWVLFISVRFT